MKLGLPFNEEEMLKAFKEEHEAKMASSSKGKKKKVKKVTIKKTLGEGTFGKVKLGSHILSAENVNFFLKKNYFY